MKRPSAGARRTSGAFAALLLLAASSCATMPSDPFAGAEWALARGDLVGALERYDEVPIAHPRYPEARAGAANVERKLRKSHELLLHGMHLRSEWRDDEAIAMFERARAIWPALESAEGLIAATRHRLELLPGGDAEPASGVQPAMPAGPAVETKRPAPPPPPPVEEDDLVDDVLAAQLAAIEAKLQGGKLDDALVDLLALHRSHAHEARVRVRLARVLQQRALLRYGQGALELSIADCKRVLELDPGATVVRALLTAAESELRGDGPGRID